MIRHLDLWQSDNLLAYDSTHSPTLVYICTLGVTKQYRQLGIGKARYA